jgi:TonB family protein
MVQSGFQTGLQALRPQFEVMILGKWVEVKHKRVATIRRAIDRAFAADRAQRMARKLLSKRLLPDDVDEVARWYSSPLGKRITERELTLTPFRFDSGNPASAQGDQAGTVDAESLEKIKRIHSACGVTKETSVHLSTSVSKIQQLLWGANPVGAGDLAARLAELTPVVERTMILMYAKALHEVTDGELDGYAAFAETPAARRWCHAMWDALDLVLTKGTEEVLAAARTLPPLREGKEITRPTKISGAPPSYTEAASKAGVEGQVVVEAIIDKAGNVAEAHVRSGLSLGLDEAALEAVKAWKFKPATLLGQPIEVYYTLTVNFKR